MAPSPSELLERAGGNPLRVGAGDVPLHLFSDVSEWIAIAEVAGAVRDAVGGASTAPDLAAEYARLCPGAHLTFLTKGRAAELALVGALGLDRPVVLTHGLFSTTRRALARCAATVEPVPLDSRAGSPAGSPAGSADLDLDALRARLGAGGVALVYLEPANNGLCGRPLGLDHLAAVRALCDDHGARLVLDAPRLFTNAALSGQRDLLAAARSMLELAHAFTISCAKEHLAPYGALVGSTDPALIGRVAAEAFQSGTSLGPLEPIALHVALSAGLRHVCAHPELITERGARIDAIRDRLLARGLAVDGPRGAHAVFVVLPAALAPGASADAMLSLLAHLFATSGILAQIFADAAGRPLLRLALALGRAVDPEAVAGGVAEFVRTAGAAPALRARPGQDAVHPYFRQLAPV